jgi:hypothetical protein
MNTPKPTHHDINLQAYYFWEQYGRPTEAERSAVSIWLEAESFLFEEWEGVS